MSFETGGTCVLAWKRREGIGSLLSKQKWEQRWFFLADNQLLYYCMGEEDRFGEEDFAPRGRIDLKKTHCRVEVCHKLSPDAPTKNEVQIESTEILEPRVSTTEKARKPVVTKWRLCFETQQALVEFLEKAHAILEDTGQLEEKDTERFEHEFQAGDHIYRWEMIVCPPVIYPIQIHGIVLEAGRNCVVVADFGLTGYGKKSTKDDFHHASETDKEQHNKLVAAFKKLRPHSDQRLHITTLTDPQDIRKWTRAHYDEHSFQAPDKLKKLTKLLKRVKLKKPNTASLKDEMANPPDELVHSPEPSQNSENSDHDDNNPRQRAYSEEYANKRQEEHPLPKADPKEIVLSRANFILEFGEEKLPPYHVFFSNSECIAVWCKTGRWSTLQTAVFLSSNSIGGAKSATVATLGVAAAHAILAPLVVAGGLLWVSAPMVILQKSREKWETNTHYMTDLYWQWAPPKVFVSAIEHWSEVGWTTQQKLLEEEQQAKQQLEEENNTSRSSLEIKKYSSEEILNNSQNQTMDAEEATNALFQMDKECKQEHEEEEFESIALV